jgi:signal peptidase II
MTDDHAQLRARRIRALTIMFTVAAVVVAADAISKALVLGRLREHQPVQLLHGLITLDLTFNAGAAFGVGTSYTAVIALIVCGVIVYIIRTARRLRSLAWTIGLGLLLGGAVGNLGDRLFRAPGPLRGQVVDWINLPHFPWTFDLADASITCAAVIIAILAIRGVRIDGTTSASASAAERTAAPAPAPLGHRVPPPAPAPAATSATAPAPAATAPAPAPAAPAQCNGGRYDGPPPGA